MAIGGCIWCTVSEQRFDHAFAVILGMVLGFLIAIVRSTHDKTGKLGFLNVLARIYLTIIRGTPVVVQLLIIYFVIFASVNVGKNLLLPFLRSV